MIERGRGLISISRLAAGRRTFVLRRGLALWWRRVFKWVREAGEGERMVRMNCDSEGRPRLHEKKTEGGENSVRRGEEKGLQGRK